MEKPTFFTVVLEEDAGSPGFWSSPALTLPSAKLGRVVDDNGAAVPGIGSTGLGVTVPSGSVPKRLLGSISVPSDLKTKDDLEVQKLAFDRERQSLSDTWQRRTFAWTVISALLSLTVTIAGQTLLAPRKSGTSVSTEQAEACRNSLKRTSALTAQPGQTVGALGQAVRQHEATCDELLIKLMSQGER